MDLHLIPRYKDYEFYFFFPFLLFCFYHKAVVIDKLKFAFPCRLTNLIKEKCGGAPMTPMLLYLAIVQYDFGILFNDIFFKKFIEIYRLIVLKISCSLSFILYSIKDY